MPQGRTSVRPLNQRNAPQNTYARIHTALYPHAILHYTFSIPSTLMSTTRPSQPAPSAPNRPQITIDAQPTTIWRHQPLQRPTGLQARQFHPQPATHRPPLSPSHALTLHAHTPRRPGPSGVALVPTGLQHGLELWTEAEKFEIWPAQPVALETLSALDTKANSLTTTANATIPAEISRQPLSEHEYALVQQDRLIAATSLAHSASPQPSAFSLHPSAFSLSPPCPTCGLIHGSQFTSILIPAAKPIPVTLSGVLPDIVACVHKAQAQGHARLSTKDETLQRICGGYRSPSKAFHDLRQSAAYRALFDTSRRGFISLRHAPPVL